MKLRSGSRVLSGLAVLTSKVAPKVIPTVAFIIALTVFVTLRVQASVENTESRAHLTLQDALLRIGEVSPLIREANQRVKEADASIGVARSAVLPQISAQALWSSGNPGVFSVQGVDANFGTNERLGEGLGLDLKQDIYDFGRSTHEIAAEEARKTSEQSAIETEKARAQIELLHVYVKCAFLTSSVATSERIAALSRVVARETDRFVKSGQRSIIERYLVDSQTQEAETKVAETKAKLAVLEKRLTQLLQLPRDSTANCGNLSTLFDEARRMKSSLVVNAFLRVENEKLKQFEEMQKFAHADFMPRLYLEAQGGYFRAERTNQNWNYGVAVGVSLPLYTGDRIESKVGEAQAQYERQRAVVARTFEKIEQENFGYDEQIQSLDVRLTYLEKENELARKVFDLAKDRYTKLQGSMIDLRESIRELMRVLDERDQTISQLAQAMVQRSLWNEAYSR